MVIIEQLSLITLVITAVILAGILVILKSFTFSRHFYQNQYKRESILREILKENDFFGDGSIEDYVHIKSSGSEKQ